MSGFAYVIENKDKTKFTLKQLDDYSIVNNKYDIIFNKKVKWTMIQSFSQQCSWKCNILEFNDTKKEKRELLIEKSLLLKQGVTYTCESTLTTASKSII